MATNKYHHGKIYKMVNLTDDLVYVGATTNELYARKQGHKNKTVRSPAQKHWDIIGWQNVEIVLLEAVNCENRFELRRRERHWIDLLHPELNAVLPQTFQEADLPKIEWDREYYTENRPAIIEKKKQYKTVNKIAITEYRKSPITCQCGTASTKHNLKIHQRTIKCSQLRFMLDLEAYLFQ